ncbi:hypothetical protein [Streptococcus uberis]|nr:hypothetical protein [Streptococcus uberis]MCK1242412.1 hypothetical protein [Streptococcus uberis]
MKAFVKVSIVNEDEYNAVVDKVHTKTHELQQALRELEDFRFETESKETSFSSND